MASRKTVQFDRETKALIVHLGKYCGSELHRGFRLHCDRPDRSEAYRAVLDLGCRWTEVTTACARTSIRYGLINPCLRRSANRRDKLGWLIARRSLQVIRALMWQEHERQFHGAATILFEFISHKLKFADYRLLTEYVADDMLIRMCWKTEDCPDCQLKAKKRRGRLGSKCEDCDQQKCPIHCHCAVREDLRDKQATG